MAPQAEEDEPVAAAHATVHAAQSSSCWQRYSSTFITAVSNFGVQYNYESIGWSMIWLHLLYSDQAWADTLSKNMIFVGTLIGMVALGVLGDVMGLNRAMTLTLTIQALGALLQAIIPWGDDTQVWILLIASRTLLGIGAGGVYPLCA